VVIAGDAGPTLMVSDRRGEPPDGPPRILEIEFDAAYMKETWLPELVEKDLGSDYHVWIRGPEGVLWATSDAPKSMAGGEGAGAPLFLLRVGPGRGKGGGPGGPGKGFGKKDKGPPPDGKKDKGPPPDQWRVEAAFKSGAMSDLVESLRVRNLAVSFGILLLMGASIAMLMRSTRRANVLAQQQMEFVAGVTHELRTPLAVILSASQNLADGVASGAAQTQRYGGVIHAQTRRLSSMVEQVLRFAGLSSQHGEIQRAPVAIHELLAEAVKDSEPELMAAGCKLKQDIAEALPELQGDRAALLHCLRNLLSNAAKHAPGANVTLRVGSDGAGMVEIAVEDQGPGFAPGDLPHLFEPFYRGGRAKDEQVQGSGLGLSLVKKIVEAHGGKVEATNRAGGGAVIRMLLPLKGA
jgi:signal transduction histidine kinase